MKQSIYLVSHPCKDEELIQYGQSSPIILYASTSRKERDENFSNYLYLEDVYKEERILDLDNIARYVWKNLNPIEKLSLERTDCPIWHETPQSKYSV